MKSNSKNKKKMPTIRWPASPSLRLSPTAWAKLLFLRDLGDTEVGGFGIAAADDLLYVEDVQLVRQECTAVSVVFDDEAVADFFDRQVDRGLRPEQFARVWVHSHPGHCAEPSIVDEETFSRVFGKSDWAVMFILARGGQTCAELSFHIGPGGSTLIPVSVDYSRPFAGSDQPGWKREYQANVQIFSAPLTVEQGITFAPAEPDLPAFVEQDEWPDAWGEYLADEQEPLLQGVRNGV